VSGCTGESKTAPSPSPAVPPIPTPTAAAPVARPVEPQAQPAPPPAPPPDPLAPFVENLSGGWRDLRWGMSEAEVRKLILKHRTSSDVWERHGQLHRDIDPSGPKWIETSFPALSLSTLEVDSCRDLNRFYYSKPKAQNTTWRISDLDDGARSVRALFRGGKLVAIKADGKVPLEVFVEKAAEAYGKEHRRVEVTFRDCVFGYETEKKMVALWRGNGTTIIIWATKAGKEMIPSVLATSDSAMEAIEADYQAEREAEKKKDEEREKKKNKSTTF